MIGPFESGVLAQTTDEAQCPSDGVCGWVLDVTSNQAVADGADWFVRAPLKIFLIVLVGWIANRIARRSITTFVAGLQRTAKEVAERTPRSLLVGGEDGEDVRLVARTQTISSVLRSITSVVVWTVVAMLVMIEFGISLGPLLASAGVVGVAFGFGAQSIVKDFLSGLFMIIEDQYGVGDLIDVGDASGTVEHVGLRSTRLRDLKGTVWHVPNGEIRRVANLSQYFSKALVDVDVAYDTDVRSAITVIEVATGAFYDEERAGDARMLEAPVVLGVQALGADAVTIRLVVTTEPSEQFGVERELRLRLKEALDAAGIEIPFPQRTVWLRTDDGSAESTTT